MAGYNYNRDLEDHKLVMGQMSYEEEMSLVQKNLAIWQYAQDFWAPAIAVGEQSFDRLSGKFFSAAEKAEMALQDKIPIEIAEGMPKMQAMVGMMELSRKDGVIVPQGGEDAPPAEVINIVLKSIERQVDLKSSETDAFKTGIIAGMPQLAFFDLPRDPMSDRSLDINVENWKATYVDPNFRRQDLSDADFVIRVRLVNKEQCLSIAPDREKEIEAEFANLPILGAGGFGATAVSTDRQEMFTYKQQSADLYAKTGRVYLIERQSLIRAVTSLLVSPNSEQAEILPTSWAPERVQAWRAEHPDYEEVQMPVRVLWVTTCLVSGLLLKHGPHWYQEGEYACECYVPQMLNEQSVGWFQYANGNLKLGAIAKTEHIHSIRLATNGPVAIQEGTLANEQDVTYELARPDGRIITKRGVDASQAIFPIQRAMAKQDWELLYTETMETNNRLLVDRNVEGGTQSSQESAKVVQSRVTQTLNKQAVYLQNFHTFVKRNRRKILKMLQYVMTQEQVIRYVDEKNGASTPTEVTVNQPSEFDWTGTATKIVNNLDGAMYDYVEAENDTSVTGRMNELIAFQEMMQAGSAVPPDMWGEYVASLPNAIAQKMAAKIAEKAKAAEANQGPPPPKVTVTLNPKDAPFNEAWFETYKDLTGHDLSKALQTPTQPAPAPEQAPEIPQAVPPEMQGAMQ